MIHNQVKCCALCKLLYGIDATQTTKEGLALAQLYLDQGLVEQAASHLSQIKGTWRQIRFRYAHGWQDGTSSGSCPSVSLTATLLRIEAELELSKRNIEAARKCLDRAEQLYPSPRSWELYARSFCTSSGDPWESIRWYTKVLEKESRDGNIREEIRIHKMLGVIYLDRTDVEGRAAAETHFQTALALTSSRFGPESDATHRLELDIAQACLQKGALQFGMAPALKLAAFLDEHLTQGHDANVSWRFVKDMTWQYHMEIGDFGQARRIVSEIRRKQTLAMPHIAALVDKRRETELDLMEAMALSRGGYERSALKILAKVDSRVILKSQKLRARLKMVLASITEQALVAFMLRSKPELLSCCGVTQPSTASPAWNKYSQPVRELRRPSEI
ncbi:uncharacterized protein BJ171DRAFT_507378 [Polychytrium aggregatum]|uniref:uncharacterized protein n=1 Tax=Polychytrium aggregatum TaxID=110093 RepID=UPI0022FE1DDC|nr:uncharacterized protein BJ171DRAFT_507378 [Polychytrium aggregatum]KAI9204006.1 hypothetical protein BJ171DRAFT_507378 [Polychytrium aggregatum]